MLSSNTQHTRFLTVSVVLNEDMSYLIDYKLLQYSEENKEFVKFIDSDKNIF